MNSVHALFIFSYDRRWVVIYLNRANSTPLTLNEIPVDRQATTHLEQDK